MLYQISIPILGIHLCDFRPHELVKRRCSNVWFCKGTSHWSIYFKFKKLRPIETTTKVDFIEELGRIDANPEEDSQVLQVYNYYTSVKNESRRNYFYN